MVYVLDMAEIPTYQAGKIDPHAYAARIAAGAHLTVAGRAVKLTPIRTALAHPPGAGGLPTTRLEIVLRGPLLHGATAIAYRDTNYSDRIGWKEIVIGATTPSISHDLRAYPKDMLQSPLSQTTARTALAPLAGAAVPPKLDTGKTLEARDRTYDSGFASLVGRHRTLSAFVILRRRSPQRCSGARPTRSHARARQDGSSPRTSSASAARRGMRRCSG